MATPFDAIDAVHQMQPTSFEQLDARMAFKSDENSVANKDDARLLVRFYTRSVRDEEASLAAGRVIHKDALFINIKIPGDKHNDVNRIAFPEDKMRFPQHFQKFMQGQEQVIGTPLSVVPFLTESQVEDYRGVNIRTVEQLAGLSDANAQRYLGSVDHEQKAQQFLDGLKSADSIREEFQAKIDALEAKLAELTPQE